MHNSTTFYHISLIKTCFHIIESCTSDCLASTSPILSPSTHVFKQLVFFCVFIPTILPLNVDSFLSHESLSIILDHCIATSREFLYIWFYHSVSVSVYNVLLVLLLSLCINSWRSFQFTWNFSSSLFL